jgi:uncharacterized protein YeaO (DUF488 family)
MVQQSQYRKDKEMEDLLFPEYGKVKVNVGSLWTKLPNPVSIARITPDEFPGIRILSLFPAGEALAPPMELIRAFKNRKIDWAEYCRRYEAHFLSTLERMGLTFNSTTDALVVYINKLAEKLGVDEVTLCCWEGKKSDHCHRRWVYSKLPRTMKGAEE